MTNRRIKITLSALAGIVCGCAATACAILLGLPFVEKGEYSHMPIAAWLLVVTIVFGVLSAMAGAWAWEHKEKPDADTRG